MLERGHEHKGDESGSINARKGVLLAWLPQTVREEIQHIVGKEEGGKQLLPLR